MLLPINCHIQDLCSIGIERELKAKMMKCKPKTLLWKISWNIFFSLLNNCHIKYKCKQIFQGNLFLVHILVFSSRLRGKMCTLANLPGQRIFGLTLHIKGLQFAPNSLYQCIVFIHKRNRYTTIKKPNKIVFTYDMYEKSEKDEIVFLFTGEDFGVCHMST